MRGVNSNEYGITDNAVSDGMNFNNMKSEVITADHEIGELKLNAYQNVVDLSHQENEGERNTSHLIRERGKKELHIR